MMQQFNPVLLQTLRQDYEAVKQIGSPLLQCQGMLVPRDPNLAHMRFLVVSCPRPMVTNLEPATVVLAGGLEIGTAGSPKNYFEGSLSVLETENGHVQMFAEAIMANKGVIDCDYYDGRPDSYTAVYELTNCLIRLEPSDMTADSRSQVTTISGSISYSYFGRFSNIGTSGTQLSGSRPPEGIQGSIQYVQGLINAAQQGVNIANNVSSLASSVRGLLG